MSRGERREGRSLSGDEERGQKEGGRSKEECRGRGGGVRGRRGGE